MPGEIVRQWFVPGDGIDRHVISGDIQRYLGNDATVRPGRGTNEHEGVPGYWIKAYRNLTNAMIADLKADSLRWRQEQQQTGTRDGYVGSTTYNSSAATVGNGRGNPRRGGDSRGDSPSVEGPFVAPPRGDRMPPRNMPDRMPVDSMDVDMPAPSQDRRYQQGRSGYPPPDNRQFPPSDGRGYPVDARGFQTDQPIPDSYGGGRIPVPSPFGQDPRFPPNYQQPNGGVPPGYARQGEHFVPVSSYDTSPGMTTRIEQPPFGGGPYGQQPPSRGNDPRDLRDRDPRDPRYQQEFQDGRYAYPSPAATIINPREREPVSSPQQPPSGYPPSLPSQYDPSYGSRPMQNQFGQQDPGYMPPRQPDYSREQPRRPTQEDRPVQRRRVG